MEEQTFLFVWVCAGILMAASFDLYERRRKKAEAQKIAGVFMERFNNYCSRNAWNLFQFAFANCEKLGRGFVFVKFEDSGGVKMQYCAEDIDPLWGDTDVEKWHIKNYSMEREFVVLTIVLLSDGSRAIRARRMVGPSLGTGLERST